MTALAPTLQAFFTDRLAAQKNASPHTVTSYRDTLRLLLLFTTERTGSSPAQLQFEDVDAPLVGAFLDYLEHHRGNSVRSRNTRLAAIRSLFRFAALRHPEHAALIARVLAIPPKRCDRAVVSFLADEEIDALLAAPDTSRWIGRRDHALLLVAAQTGLRVSELTGLCCRDVHLGSGAHVRCLGKGRKQRCTPLTGQTVAVLRAWLRERQGHPEDPLFPTSRGRPLSRDTVALLVTKHATTARQRCPSIGAKTITPHVLRHSAAMRLLHAGVDTSVIALWLGHEKTDTVQIYLNSRELHQPGEIREVCPRTKGRNAVPTAQHRSFVTWDYARLNPLDARFARQPGKIMRTDGLPRARPTRPEPARERGANLRVRRPDGVEEHQRGEGSGLACADQLRAFRRLEYPSPPVHADLSLKERALARTTPLDSAPGRYRPPDALLAFLEAL